MDDLRQSPATMTLAVLWVFVYMMMQARQGQFVWSSNPFVFGTVNVAVSHQYGDATTAELLSGQVWRAVTSTFIHFSLLHLVLNLAGLVPLGLMIEDRYGSSLFLAIYLVIGGLGNLLAAYIRPWFGIVENLHSGGGSTVVFGLLGLCAVVGLRSRTRDGRELAAVMVGLLLFNVAISVGFWLFRSQLGARLPNLDNAAHATGTLLGGLIGFCHARLVEWSERPVARGAGLLGASVLIACMAAQTRTSRAEAEANDLRALAHERWQQAAQHVQQTDALRNELARLEILYHMIIYRYDHPDAEGAPAGLALLRVRPNLQVVVPALPQVRDELGRSIERLRSAHPTFESEAPARAYRRLLALAAEALTKPPTRLRLQEFTSHLAVVFASVQQELAAAQAHLRELQQAAQAAAAAPNEPAARRKE